MATDASAVGYEDVVMTATMPSPMFERWATSRGPEWLALVTPLKDLLQDDPADPPDLKSAIAPLQWVLRQARARSLPLEEDGVMRRDIAIAANKKFGFRSPPTTVRGEMTFLEIETMLQLARNMGSTWPGPTSEELTDCGCIVASKPQIIWREAAECLGVARPPGIYGAVWEILLTWLLQPDVDGSVLPPLIEEAAAVLDHELPEGGDDEAWLDFFEMSITSLYTFCRALSMFAAETPTQFKPQLSEMGRATTIKALRASVLYGPTRGEL